MAAWSHPRQRAALEDEIAIHRDDGAQQAGSVDCDCLGIWMFALPEEVFLPVLKLPKQELGDHGAGRDEDWNGDQPWKRGPAIRKHGLPGHRGQTVVVGVKVAFEIIEVRKFCVCWCVTFNE